MNFAEIFIIAAFVILIARVVIPRFGSWNKTFDTVAKRYNALVFRGYFFSRPNMSFNYGKTMCRVRSRRSSRFKERRQTDVEMTWPDKDLRLVVSSLSDSRSGRSGSRGWSNPFRRKAVPVDVGDGPFKSKLQVKSNQPELAAKMFSGLVQWQVEQLRRHLGNEQLFIEISSGKFIVSKPTFIKKAVLLDDFIRYSLELFDRLSLVDCEGIEFINEDHAKVVDDCVCPICSEQIEHEMVLCVRCKSPHCLDCWQYNGQCATFACKETRFLRSSDPAASA